MSLDDWNKEFDKMDEKLQKAFTKSLEDAVEHLDRDLNNLVQRTSTEHDARSYATLEAARIRKQIIGIIRNLQDANDYPEG